MTLGQILKRYRFEQDISARELAERSGVSPAYISILEKGKNPNGRRPNPSKETCTGLANAMGLSYDELMEMIDVSPPDYENHFAIPSNKYGLLEMCLKKIGWALESTKNSDAFDFTLNNGTFSFGVTANDVDMLAEGLYSFMSMAVEGLMKESYERMVANMHKKPVVPIDKPVREAPYTKEDLELILSSQKSHKGV